MRRVTSESHSVGRYRILRPLAEGGMGRVLLARTEGPAGFSKTVVLKTLHKHLADDLAFLESFLAEARLSALLHHPNVAQVFELVEQDGEYFLAMEYVRGRSLRELLAAGGPLPSHVAAGIVTQVARALAHAHSATDDSGRPLHIVHRDVSPENVLVSEDGAVKLLDFGLSGASTRRAGKRGYFAPELLEGAKASSASDIYAAGVVLVELITGELPSSSLSLPSAAEWLLGIANKALATTAQERFLTANQLADELERAAREKGLPLSSAELAELVRQRLGRTSIEEPAPIIRGARTAVLTAVEPLTNHAPSLADGGSPPPLSREVGVAPQEGAKSLPWKRLLAASAALMLLFWGGMQVLPSARENAKPSPSASGPSAAVTTSPANVPLVTSPQPPSLAPPASGSALTQEASTSTPASDHAPTQEASTPTPASDHALTRPDRPRSAGSRATRDAQPTSSKARGPRTGLLDLRVNPWADVKIDGKGVGTTPFAPLTVSEGSHVVELTNSDLSVHTTRKVRVRAGAEEVLRVDLLDVLSNAKPEH